MFEGVLKGGEVDPVEIEIPEVLRKTGPRRFGVETKIGNTTRKISNSGSSSVWVD